MSKPTTTKDSPQLALYSLACATFAAVSLLALLSLLGLQSPIDGTALSAAALGTATAKMLGSLTLVLAGSLAGLFLVLGARRARRRPSP